jgi:hypothetical protein
MGACESAGAITSIGGRPPTTTDLERVATVDATLAFRYLGIGHDLGWRALVRYRKRTAALIATGRPVSLEDVKPRRDKRTGEWLEIANMKVGGKVRCRTDLLVWQLHPERAPW